MRAGSRPHDRRTFLKGAGASVLGILAGESMASPDPFRAIEKSIGGRVGVVALDTGSGRSLFSRPDERFAMCSTFKWLLAAAVLSRVDAGTLSLDKSVSITGLKLLEHSPVTGGSRPSGMFSIEELSAAIVEDSDNTAANLLLSMVDGPSGLTRFMRGAGDSITRLDRYEPALNENHPHDERDTTTPRAMVSTLNTLLLGSVLTTASRERLISWMKNGHTGSARLRAGLPNDWVTGDKTGTGEHGAVNDLAISWPPRRAPILIASYLSDSKRSVDVLSAAHARIAHIVAGTFSRT